MNRFALIAVASLGLTVAACGDDTTDDVVQAPAAGGAPTEVSENRADVAETQTALALGMTRDELEDADLLSAERTDLGDVESLVLDASNTVTHVVIDLEGPGDFDVVVPLDQITSITIDGETDLQTALSAEQLRALPRYDDDAVVG